MPRISLLSIAALTLAACSTPLPLPNGGDGGASDLGAACASAHDTASCQAIPGCKAVGCPACGGGTDFVLCVAPGQAYGVDCAAPCSQPACADLKDGATCDARPDCYALYSGDLPCNDNLCSNHFVSCQAAPANCGQSAGPPCAGSCVMATPSCPSGLVNAFPGPTGSCCSNGCVAAGKCDPLGG